MADRVVKETSYGRGKPKGKASDDELGAGASVSEKSKKSRLRRLFQRRRSKIPEKSRSVDWSVSFSPNVPTPDDLYEVLDSPPMTASAPHPSILRSMTVSALRPMTDSAPCPITRSGAKVQRKPISNTIGEALVSPQMTASAPCPSILGFDEVLDSPPMTASAPQPREALVSPQRPEDELRMPRLEIREMRQEKLDEERKLIQKHETEMEIMQTKMSNLEKQLGLDDEVRMLRHEIRELRQEKLDEERKLNQKHESEMKIMQNKMSNLEKQLDENTKQIEDLKKQIADMQRKESDEENKCTQRNETSKEISELYVLEEVTRDFIDSSLFKTLYGNQRPKVDVDDFEMMSERWLCCNKNHHEKFISMAKFMKSPELPVGYDFFLDFIMIWSELTVKLFVDLLNDNGLNQCFHPKSATGFFIDVEEFDPSKSWKVYIATAAHVLSSNEEAMKLKARISNNSGEILYTLSQPRICELSRDLDTCVVSFITEEKSLVEKVMDDFNRLRQMEKPRDIDRLELEEDPIVIISHPHGESKHISVGERTVSAKKPVSCYLSSEYTYTTHTCKGSSGAAVLTLNKGVSSLCQRFFYSNFHVHSSMSEDRDINLSGAIQEPVSHLSQTNEILPAVGTDVNDNQWCWNTNNVSPHHIGDEILKGEFDNCIKHPGHTDFKPVHELTLDDLPSDCRENKEMLHFLKLLGLITVRVKSQWISDKRPDPYPGIKLPNPIPKGSTRIGSGFLAFLRKAEPNDSTSDALNSNYGFAHIITNKYLIFDSDEAAATEIDIPFVLKELGITNVSLKGIRVVDSNITADYAVVQCGIKGELLYNTLERIQKQLHQQEPKVVFTDQHFAAIISYIHGQGPFVSFGHWIERKVVLATEDFEQTQYSFSTPVCKGSAGALVYIPQQGVTKIRDRFLITHIHSGVKGEYNRSGWCFEKWIE